MGVSSNFDDRPVAKVLFGDLRPGETPIDDFTGLKVPGISTLRELASHETDNIADALVDYLSRGATKRASFDLDGARALHHDMFCNVGGWAVQFRSVDINIPFASRFGQIPERLHNLLEDSKVWADADLIKHAAWLHHRAVQIHPFTNGNGRWSRLLANAWLTEKQLDIVYWPADLGEISPVRGEYIAALKAADNGDYDPLIALHRRFMPPQPSAA